MANNELMETEYFVSKTFQAHQKDEAVTEVVKMKKSFLNSTSNQIAEIAHERLDFYIMHASMMTVFVVLTLSYYSKK